MSTCTIAPGEKRKIGRGVGRELALKFGRKPYYSRLEVKRVMRRLAFPDTWDCWAFSLYLSHSDFDAHHTAIGEVCDYTSMRNVMVDATLGGLPSGLDAEHSWLDWAGFDFSGLFDATDVA